MRESSILSGAAGLSAALRKGGEKMGFVEIKAEDIVINPFTLFDREWTLITAAKEGEVNTMTASWGGLGTVWGKSVATVYIRPQRYTKEFVDAGDSFSITVFPEEFRERLSYLGRVSGREENKIAKAGLTVAYENGIPYFEEAKLALFVKKLFASEIRPEDFTDKKLSASIYPAHDYHTIYIAEVTKILKKERAGRV